MAPPREHQLLQLLSLFIFISALLIAWRAVPCSDDPFGAVEHPMCRPSKSSGRVSPPPMPQRPGDDEPRRPSSSFTVRKKNGMPQGTSLLFLFSFTLYPSLPSSLFFTTLLRTDRMARKRLWLCLLSLSLFACSNAQDSSASSPLPAVPGAVLSRFAFTSPAGAPLELEAYIDASQSGPGPETRTVIIVAHGHGERLNEAARIESAH